MTEVFVDVATQSPETIVAVAAADQSVYQSVVQESISTGGMTAAALVQDIASDLAYSPGAAAIQGYDSGISYDSDWNMRTLTYETAMAAGYTPGMSSLISDPYDMGVTGTDMDMGYETDIYDMGYNMDMGYGTDPYNMGYGSGFNDPYSPGAAAMYGYDPYYSPGAAAMYAIMILIILHQLMLIAQQLPMPLVHVLDMPLVLQGMRQMLRRQMLRFNLIGCKNHIHMVLTHQLHSLK